MEEPCTSLPPSPLPCLEKQLLPNKTTGMSHLLLSFSSPLILFLSLSLSLFLPPFVALWVFDMLAFLLSWQQAWPFVHAHGSWLAVAGLAGLDNKTVWAGSDREAGGGGTGGWHVMLLCHPNTVLCPLILLLSFLLPVTFNNLTCHAKHAPAQTRLRSSSLLPQAYLPIQMEEGEGAGWILHSCLALQWKGGGRQGWEEGGGEGRTGRSLCACWVGSQWRQ